jgi:hypothetical protein
MGSWDRGMPFVLETSTASEFLEFSAEQAAVRLPSGKYLGQSAKPAHLLGDNGANLKWVYVTILKAPGGADEWVGKQVNVRVHDADAQDNRPSVN